MRNGKRIGVALSGGGYRAAAYHLGTLRALHNLGLLSDVDVISSVSGGSIIAADYVLNQSKGYKTFEGEFIQKLQKGVLCHTILYLIFLMCGISALMYFTPSGYRIYELIVFGIAFFFMWYSILPVSKIIAYSYNKRFYHEATLDQLPATPILSINATDLSTGNLFSFSQNRMSCFPYKNSIQFSTKNFPVANAVMASSCVPQFFSPVKIEDSFCTKKDNKVVKPLLVDGGLYDNQGAQRFTSNDSYFHVDYAIVSDAGNTIISSRWSINPFLVLYKTSDVLMRRIKNFQRQHNSYVPAENKASIFVYNDLMWTDYVNMPKRFVQNIKSGYIAKETIAAHGITNEQLERLYNPETSANEAQTIQEIIERNINWNDFTTRIPQKHKTAASVCTNLIGLNTNQITSLMEHAEWMTELQIKMHLPFLLNN